MNPEVKIYMITFFVDNRTNLEALHRYLADSVDVQGFWNYIPLVYCIKSPLSSTELSNKLEAFLPAGFAVAEINIRNIDGRIPAGKPAWDWFYQPPSPKHPTIASLGGLLGLAPPSTK